MEIKARIIVALCLLSGFSLPVFADTSLWQDVKTLANKTLSANDAAKTKSSESTSQSGYQNARLLNLDLEQMTTQLNTKNLAAKNARSKQTNTKNQIELPMPDGSFVSVSIAESQLLPSILSEKFPKLKVLNVIPDDQIVSGKLDVTEKGFHAMLQTRKGEMIFIDPTENGVYASYLKSDQHQDSNKSFSCGAHSQKNFFEKSLKSAAFDEGGKTEKSLIIYRIAIAATGEYTQKHGGTKVGAMSAITTTINRVNQVFEQDLGIRLVLVENNDELVYEDENSDPYTGDDSKQHLYQNQYNIDSVIGSDNYDIGHLFTASGGGLAAIGSACSTNRKAQGVSGISNPRNDSFNLDFVAHEIGHQIGATHTFNGVQGLCSGDTRTAATAFEPGSGSTIMSYAGYCGGDNLQSNTDAMFHIGSIQQIRSFVTGASTSNCGVDSRIGNEAPKVEAGVNHVIPAQTPFELVGEASDADGDALIYGWEQVDAGEVSTVNSDTGDNAIFRVHPLASQKSRVFPPIQNIVNHVSQRGENLPIQQRLMKFKFVVQDSYNNTQSDSMSLLVQRTGSRFALSMPRSQYSLGETHKILWNVADTDKTPVNCSNVDISLSVNGGYDFNHILEESVPNTGEAWVTIPSTLVPTSQGRFKIRCSDNIFFAISYRNFDINGENHSERSILSDEDQPESDLEDFDLSKIENIEVAETSSGEGGGTLGWLFMLLLLTATKRMKKFNYISF